MTKSERKSFLPGAVRSCQNVVLHTLDDFCLARLTEYSGCSNPSSDSSIASRTCCIPCTTLTKTSLLKASLSCGEKAMLWMRRIDWGQQGRSSGGQSGGSEANAACHIAPGLPSISSTCPILQRLQEGGVVGCMGLVIREVWPMMMPVPSAVQ